MDSTFWMKCVPPHRATVPLTSIGPHLIGTFLIQFLGLQPLYPFIITKRGTTNHRVPFMGISYYTCSHGVRLDTSTVSIRDDIPLQSEESRSLARTRYRDSKQLQNSSELILFDDVNDRNKTSLFLRSTKSNLYRSLVDICRCRTCVHCSRECLLTGFGTQMWRRSAVVVAAATWQRPKANNNFNYRAAFHTYNIRISR